MQQPCNLSSSPKLFAAPSHASELNMLKKLKHYARIVTGKAKPKPIVVSRQDHCISRNLIDADALKVMYRLRRADHIAYLAGGGVRDILLDRKPKDFDVVTDAHPNQIKRLFRNCFLVGRRFRLAHIRFGDKVIETSTFRRQPPPSADPAKGEGLLQKRANTFGTPEEDARMRDFTINGLYYDISTFSIIDHVGGQRDLDRKLIRCIGNPRIRFPEDPVRMIRAVRFASRMGFTIEKTTYRAIVRQHREIEKAAPPRLLEEVYRLFGFGTGHAAFRLLADTKLLRVILPAVNAHVTAKRPGDLSLWACLEAFDRIKPDKSVPVEAAILSVLFYPLFDAKVRKMEAKKENIIHQAVARDVLREGMGTLPIPRRIIDRMVRAFDAQRRFVSVGRRFSRKRFVLQATFADALLLREIVLRARDEGTTSLVPWRKLRKQCESEAAAAPEPSPGPDAEAPEEKKRPVRRRRRRRKPGSSAAKPPAAKE